MTKTVKVIIIWSGFLVLIFLALYARIIYEASTGAPILGDYELWDTGGDGKTIRAKHSNIFINRRVISIAVIKPLIAVARQPEIYTQDGAGNITDSWLDKDCEYYVIDTTSNTLHGPYELHEFIKLKEFHISRFLKELNVPLTPRTPKHCLPYYHAQNHKADQESANPKGSIPIGVIE